MTCTMGFYVRYVAFVPNLLSRTWIGLPYPNRTRTKHHPQVRTRLFCTLRVLYNCVGRKSPHSGESKEGRNLAHIECATGGPGIRWHTSNARLEVPGSVPSRGNQKRAARPRTENASGGILQYIAQRNHTESNGFSREHTGHFNRHSSCHLVSRNPQRRGTEQIPKAQTRLSLSHGAFPPGKKH